MKLITRAYLLFNQNYWDCKVASIIEIKPYLYDKKKPYLNFLLLFDHIQNHPPLIHFKSGNVFLLCKWFLKTERNIKSWYSYRFVRG